MEPILAGLETEYGLYIEGRGAENQIEDSKALVRSYPDERFLGWDYRFESPRSDLRGFRVDHLQFDPSDARFDVGKDHGADAEVRADQVLANGARFYNDHGHPEYATPECWSTEELVLHGLTGDVIVAEAAGEFARQSGQSVRIFKNNSDFHGASYGAHESYLLPRGLSFEDVYLALTPMLIARTVLCGAGKVGAELGDPCDFQLSQRADFLTEAASVDTLFRRPVFNTRDEPHADPSRWMRLHVIAGDANRIPSAVGRKVGLLKLAIALLRVGAAPEWRIPHPAAMFSRVSRDPKGAAIIELGKNSWTNPREILESYFAAGEASLGVRADSEEGGTLRELGRLIADCRGLLNDLERGSDRFRRHVDWAAKRWLLEQVRDAQGWNWNEPALRSYDLEYHLLGEDSLFDALVSAGEVEPLPEPAKIEARKDQGAEPNRAWVRGLAVRKFGAALRQVSWRRIVFEIDGSFHEVELAPDAMYPEVLDSICDVGSFIAALKEIS